MGKLANIKQGTMALQARLARDNRPADTTQASDRVGDRLEGAIARLMTTTTTKANQTIYKELTSVVGLLRESHAATHKSLLQLANLQTATQAEIKDILFDLKASRPAQKSDQHLVTRLEQLASDLLTLPRSFPQASEVNLGPLTDLTSQVLAKVSIEKITPKKQHVFEIERDPFTDLITQVNVKEI